MTEPCRHCMLKANQRVAEQAAGIASGHGHYALSNSLWTFVEELREKAKAAYDPAHPKHNYGRSE
jgi:hypothetical protein